MRRASSSIRVLVVGLCIALGVGAVGCSSSASSDGATADQCAHFATCGACTPILGCGWCDRDDGTHVCSNDPAVCLGHGRWTWEPTASDTALGCPSTPPGDGRRFDGNVRELATWTDDASSGATPNAPLTVGLDGATAPTTTTDASGNFSFSDLPSNAPFVWLDVLDARGTDAETIAGVVSPSSSTIVAVFPTSLLANANKRWSSPGAGDAAILVHVVDDRGQPIAGAKLSPVAGAGVVVYDVGDDLGNGDATGPRGIGATFAVPSGSALVRIEHAGKVATFDAPTASGALTTFTVPL
jgi:hypothetical protein